MILLGESGVGKSSIISRYVHDKFNPNIPLSTAMFFFSKIITKNNKKIKLNIWDTMGQEKFRSISNLFLKDTKIVILVYSIISKESFKNLDYWLNLYKDNLDEETILGIAANKSDLIINQEVSENDGREYAKKNGGIFGLISVKDNRLGVDKFIDTLIEAYLNKKKIFNNNDNKTVKLCKKVENKNNYNNNSNSSCCSGGNNRKRQKKYDIFLKDFNGCIYSVFLGDKGVGKTSIINRFRGEKINKNEEHTNKINKYSIEYNINNNETKFKLKIYDIDVDKIRTFEFIEIIKKSNIFFLVYDVNNKESFVNVGFWFEVIKKCKEQIKKGKYLLYIIGNKNDKSTKEINTIEENRIIENNEKSNKRYIEEGKEFSTEKNGLFKAVSALENRGINNILGESIEKYLC
jgi:small GTP-binding protein